MCNGRHNTLHLLVLTKFKWLKPKFYVKKNHVINKEDTLNENKTVVNSSKEIFKKEEIPLLNYK